MALSADAALEIIIALGSGDDPIKWNSQETTPASIESEDADFYTRKTSKVYIQYYHGGTMKRGTLRSMITDRLRTA